MGALDSFVDPDTAKPAGAKTSRLDSFVVGPKPASEEIALNTPEAGKAFAENAANTLAWGYLPQGVAALAHPVDALKAVLFGNTPDNEYTQTRDSVIKGKKGREEQYPKSAFLGTAAGAGASMAMPGGVLKAGEGASALGNIARSVATGVGMGALYNPGDTPGVVDPIQAPQRAVNAVIGGGAGLLLGAGKEGIHKAAETSRAVGRVKNSAELAQGVKGKIDEAVSGVNQNYIKPREDQIKSLLAGKSVDSRIKDLEGVDPVVDRYILMQLKKQMPPGWQGITSLDQIPPHIRAGLPKELPIEGNTLNKMRRKFDTESRYAASKPFEAGSAAKGESAKAKADIARDALRGLGPEVEPVNAEVSQAMRLRDSLKGRAKTAPIAAISGRAGTDKGSIIDAIDKMGGSKLEREAHMIQSGKELLIPHGVRSFIHPLELPATAAKLGIRAGAAAARPVDAAIQKAPKGSKESLLKALMELKRHEE